MKEYREEVTFSDHHNTVNALAFSPDGRYLLSGADDGMARVFEQKKHTFVEAYRFQGISGITAVSWMSAFAGTFIAGDRLGELHTVRLYGERKATEWCGEYSKPIHCVLTEPTQSLVVIGHANMVTVERRTTPSSVEKSMRLPDPPTFPELEFHTLGRPKARAIHFVAASNLLLVSYLEHGIIAWNVTTRDIIWRIYPRTWRIGSTALSTDGKTIAATNLFDGIDWYSAEENAQQSRFRRTSMHTMAANVNVVLPIIFIHEAEEVLSGGSIGGARITSVATGQTVQLLDHGGNGSELVQAVAYHRYKDVHRIATANAELGTRTTIKLWVYRPSTSASEFAAKLSRWLPSKRELVAVLLTLLACAMSMAFYLRATLVSRVQEARRSVPMSSLIVPRTVLREDGGSNGGKVWGSPDPGRFAPPAKVTSAVSSVKTPDFTTAPGIPMLIVTVTESLSAPTITVTETFSESFTSASPTTSTADRVFENGGSAGALVG